MGNKPSVPEQLIRAAKTNNLIQLEELCTRLQQQGELEPHKRGNYLECQDEQGRTPLIIAASRNYKGVTKTLLRYGADVRYMRRGPKNGTALHEAVINDCEDAVEVLLEHHSDAFQENYQNVTPLDMAAKHKNVNIMRQLQRQAIYTGYMQLKTLAHGHPVPDGAVSKQNTNQRLTLSLKALSPEDAREFGRWIRLLINGVPPGYVAHGRPNPGRAPGLAPGIPVPQGTPYQMSLGHPGAIMHGSGQSPTMTAPTPAHLPMHVVYNVPAQHHTPPATQTQSLPRPTSSRLDDKSSTVLQALPGESDQDFARRLASMYNPTTGPRTAGPSAPTPQYPHPQYAMPPHAGQSMPHPTTTPHLPVSHSTNPQLSAAHPPPHLTFSHTMPHLTPSQGTSSPHTAHGSPGVSRNHSGRLPASPMATPTPPDSLYPSINFSGTAPPVRSQPDGHSSSPLPALPADTVASASSPGGASGSDDDLCIICLTYPREAGFLHGTSVHKCVCKECAQLIAPRSPCPMCRQPIERIIGVF